MAVILVADDEAKFRKILTLTLMEEGHEILEAADANEAIQIIKNSTVSLAITDLRMPGGGGMAVLEALQKENYFIPVIILTAYGTIENAVETLKRGAHDYLLKPCDLEELKLSVRKALQLHHLEMENQYLRTELDERYGGNIFTGNSPAIQKTLETINRIAHSNGCVLIRGETGTGKELAARFVHKQSQHAKHPFVSVKCSSIPADLLEAELFGKVRNIKVSSTTSVTGKFELAGGGTIFLDEIGSIPPRLQGRLLRAIEERVIEPVGGSRSQRINARIIAGTSTDLEDKVRKDEFRSDLYFRLNVLPVVIPPLRDRKEDIPALIKHFIKLKAGKNSPVTFLTEDMEPMLRYHWPGNVRELENVIERAVVLETSDVNILIPALHPPMSQASQMRSQTKELVELNYKEAKKTVLDDFEQRYFSSLLRKSGGNVSRAADLAQIHRKNLHVKLNELSIDPKKFNQPED
jgi:two-component system NtrC family response regulator